MRVRREKVNPETSEVRTIFGFVLTKALPGLAIFAATPYWVSAVGVSEYAVYSVGWAAAIFVSGPFSSWINQAVLRNTGDESQGIGNIPTAAMVGTVLLSAVAGLAVGFVLVVATGGFSVGTALGIALLAGATTLNSLQAAALQRNFASGALAWVMAIKNIGAVLISVALIEIFDGRTGGTILWSFVVAAIAAVVFSRIAYARYFSSDQGRTKAVLLGFWRYGWPMTIWAAASTALLYSDRLALTLILGPSESGIYAATADIIVRGFGLVAFPITMYAHPLIMRSANHNPEFVRATINRMMIIVISVAVAFALAATFAVEAGAKFLGLDDQLSLPGIILIAIGAGAWQVALIAHKFLEVQNRTGLMAVILVLIAVLSFGINLTLAPTLGVSIAPIVFASSALAYCVLTYTLGYVNSNKHARD